MGNVIDGIYDVKLKDIVIPVNDIDEVFFIGVLKWNEVGRHEATQKTLVFLVRFTALEMGFLFKSCVGVNTEVCKRLAQF